MLYIQHYIKTVHFWLKYNGFATVRKTTKLIEGGHCGFQDYRHTSTFFTTFYVFLLCFVRFLELCCVTDGKDGRTDGPTDEKAIAYSALSIMLSHGKNNLT